MGKWTNSILNWRTGKTGRYRSGLKDGFKCTQVRKFYPFCTCRWRWQGSQTIIPAYEWITVLNYTKSACYCSSEMTVSSSSASRAPVLIRSRSPKLWTGFPQTTAMSLSYTHGKVRRSQSHTATAEVKRRLQRKAVAVWDRPATGSTKWRSDYNDVPSGPSREGDELSASVAGKLVCRTVTRRRPGRQAASSVPHQPRAQLSYRDVRTADFLAYADWQRILLRDECIFTLDSRYCYGAFLPLQICPSVCLSVRPSVCHTGGSVKNGASYRITKSSLSTACLEDSSFGIRKVFSINLKGATPNEDGK